MSTQEILSYHFLHQLSTKRNRKHKEVLQPGNTYPLWLQDDDRDGSFITRNGNGNGNGNGNRSSDIDLLLGTAVAKKWLNQRQQQWLLAK